MTENKATFPAPWRSIYMQVKMGIRRWVIVDAKSKRLAEVIGMLGDDDLAKRITACVNACDGITTSELELLAGKGGFVPGYAQMQQERDELKNENGKLRDLVAQLNALADKYERIAA